MFSGLLLVIVYTILRLFFFNLMTAHNIGTTIFGSKGLVWHKPTYRVTQCVSYKKRELFTFLVQSSVFTSRSYFQLSVLCFCFVMFWFCVWCLMLSVHSWLPLLCSHTFIYQRKWDYVISLVIHLWSSDWVSIHLWSKRLGIAAIL